MQNSKIYKFRTFSSKKYKCHDSFISYFAYTWPDYGANGEKFSRQKFYFLNSSCIQEIDFINQEHEKLLYVITLGEFENFSCLTNYLISIYKTNCPQDFVKTCIKNQRSHESYFYEALKDKKTISENDTIILFVFYDGFFQLDRIKSFYFCSKQNFNKFFMDF